MRQHDPRRSVGSHASIIFGREMRPGPWRTPDPVWAVSKVWYGPYLRFGRHTAASNEAFDAQLRATDPSWGLRNLEKVVEIADQAGFRLAEIVEMPANNFGVVFLSDTRP